MALSSTQFLILCVVGVILLARPAHAFGAGNIGSTSKIEGENWRHGDLEDTLLTLVAARAMGGKKFSKLDVKRVYFGNWLRDYSQAVDVGTVKYVSAEAIRILLWVLGFMSFGYGSKEFEVTTERLGCYRPEEHIDNPKDYADNEDARQYDRRLRGPVDERRELSINSETGLKNYIASENMGITTSAGLVRNLLGRSIQLGRQYARSRNERDLFEALRLLGTASHCLEDYAAHSNYVELAMIELGEQDVFPHVGRRAAIQLPGVRHPVFPIVTGTFGGVDFLHSVCGEFDDKATQSEIQELEGTMLDSQNNQNDSILQDLLNKVPSGLFGGKDQAGKAQDLKANATAHQMQNTNISPRRPEEWTRYLNDVQKQIYPIIEWHDEIMMSITETIEKIPILPDLLEQLQDEINKFVFSLLAPFVVPIINQVKSELNTGSSEIIQSSADKQHIVFNDDHSTDPTHSMLSKDHFSNILNEAAGKVARETIRWAIPQVISCWDDERIDPNRTLNRVIYGVLHHPAQREQGQDGASDGRRAMFSTVERWWREKNEGERQQLRQQLSRHGVESGQNHKPGVVDHGHGSGKPLSMARVGPGGSGGPAGEILGAVSSVVGGGFGGQSSGQSNDFGRLAGEAVGGGVLGSLVGGLAGGFGSLASGVGGDILGGGLNDNRQTYQQSGYRQDGSYNETITQTGRSGDRYGQAQTSITEDAFGNRRQEYNRVEQSEFGSGGWKQTEVRRQERYESNDFEETRHSNRRHNEDYTEGSSNEYGSGRYGEDRTEERFGNRRNREDQNRRYEQPQRESEFGGGYNRREEQSYESRTYNERREDESESYNRRSGGGSGGGLFGFGSRDNEDNSESYRRSGYDEQRNEYGNEERQGGWGESRNEYEDNQQRGGWGEQRNEYEDNERRGGWGGDERREEYGEGRNDEYERY